MLDGLFRHGENEEGWGMLREMHQNGIELDTVALTVLMRGCIDKQQVETTSNASCETTACR